MYTILYIHCTQFLKYEHNYVYTTYTILKIIQNYVYSTYIALQIMYTIMYIQRTQIQKMYTILYIQWTQILLSKKKKKNEHKFKECTQFNIHNSVYSMYIGF